MSFLQFFMYEYRELPTADLPRHDLTNQSFVPYL